MNGATFRQTQILLQEIHAREGVYPRYSQYPHRNYRGIPGNSNADDLTDEDLANASPGEIVVLVKDSGRTERVVRWLKTLGYEFRSVGSRVIVVSLPEYGANAIRGHIKRIDALNSSDVEFVCPNTNSTTLGALSPDDIVSSQWNITAINAQTAWYYPAVRNTNFVIGVVDSGLKTSLEDISPVWTGVGADGVYGAGLDTSYDISDHLWHGTFVAGIAAAATNNGKGIAAPAGG